MYLCVCVYIYIYIYVYCAVLSSSVQFSRSVVSDSSRTHESQHARPPCPSPTPGVHPDQRPSSQWCHPAISSSVVPFSSCPQSLPASESFSMSQLFAWGGQSTGVSTSASFPPKKSQGWSPSEWTGWISLQSKGLSRVFSNTTVAQSCLTRCDPRNCSPPGSSVHGDSPGKNTGVGCHALLHICMYIHTYIHSFSYSFPLWFTMDYWI